jgi:hypothetical protein
MCILLDFMKVPLNLILLFLIFACSSPVTRNNASIAFNTQEYDFGAIPLKKREFWVDFNILQYYQSLKSQNL